MSFRRSAVNLVLKRVLDTLCRIDNRELFDALSKNGPLIVAINHINFLEVPILVTHSYPMYLTGLVKAETWKNPFFAFLFNTYQAIPIDREGAFQEAFRQAGKMMNDGISVAIFPEGTRSKSGVLGKGKGGIIHLALDTGAPVLPVAHYGGENIWENMKHFKRTQFCFKAGRPFKIRFQGRPEKEVREEMLGEVMGQIARLLPVEMRGIYTEHAERECKYLDFLA